MIMLDNPHALHGLLMLQERGARLGKAAKSAGVTVKVLEQALDVARNGNGPRAPYVDGSPHMVSEADAPRSPHGARSIPFRFEWQRHIITAMCSEGGAPTGQIEAILDRNGIFRPVSEKVEGMRVSMQRFGFDYEIADGNTPRARYAITGEKRDRALKLIENEWVA